MGIADEVRRRRHGVRLSAQRLFTNRAAEMALFNRKLTEVRSARARDPDWALDLNAPRRNVLSFYGYGGIGKTRLSCELEQTFLNEETPHDHPRRAAVRVDFAEPSARDSELFLLTLRSGLAQLADTFAAFDTAIAVYWARQHPGSSMSEFVRNQSSLGGLTDRETLAAHLKELAQGLVDGLGPLASGARRLVGLSWDKVREIRMIRNLEEDCPFFESCLAEEDLEAFRLHLPLLLAWDLARLQRSGDIEVAVFLDTFEHVSYGRRMARIGDLEDTVARSAFFLQGVTFVVTSRTPLDWGTTRRSATLEYYGPRDWPGLAQGNDDDQHEVGVFSDADCERYLARCIVNEQGDPALPADLRLGIARLSGGVPLYLDVAVNHCLSIASTGREPEMADFAAGIPEIVMRLMDDLDTDEADLLRVAALLRVFDRPTLRAALPHLRSSVVDTFLARSFVVDQGDGLFSVHELLQTSVRTQDAATSTPWSAEEWRQAEDLLVAHWASQFRSNAAELWGDRSALALAFWQLAGLYATTDVDAELLAEVIMLVQLHGVWATIEAGRNQPSELLTPRGDALLLVLDGVLARQIGNLKDTETLLSEALRVPELTGNVARLAQYYLGETLDIFEGDPIPMFRELASIDDRIGTEARLAHAHSLTRTGDLAGALAIAQHLSVDESDPEFRYRLHELLGVIWLFAGRFTQAADHFEISRQVGESEGSPLLLALGLRHLCLALCWIDPSAALALADEAESLNRDLNLPPGIGQCLMARAVAKIGSAPSEEIDDLLSNADTTFLRAGYVDDALGPVALGVLVAAVAQEDGLAAERRAELTERSHGRRSRTWLAAADAWINEDAAFDQVTWPQGRDLAYADWRVVLSRSHDSG